MKDYNNCPFCQAEQDGYSAPWGLSEIRWQELKKKHEEEHKDNPKN